MTKEVAVGKRAKISQAQQNMLLAVLGASILLGVAISLIAHFVQQIAFNVDVISAEEAAIATYSDAIKNIGICKSPKGDIYSKEELDQCDPDSIATDQIPGTLRANIMEKLAANSALNSVPNESNPDCKNPETGQQYTYEELMNISNDAQTQEKLAKSCSALRVIPDALPAFKNEEALLASLNKLFNISGWQPESLSPSGGVSISELIPGLNTLSLNLSVEADSSTTMNVLNNIERSIREFDIERATIEWKNDNALQLQAQATAYYMDESKLTEVTKTISAGGGR